MDMEEILSELRGLYAEAEHVRDVYNGLGEQMESHRKTAHPAVEDQMWEMKFATRNLRHSIGGLLDRIEDEMKSA